MPHAVFLFVLALLLFSVESLAAPNKLVLATDNTEPFSFLDKNNQARGLVVDIAREIATDTDLTLEVIFCPWARCLHMIEKGDADIAVGLFKSKQRQKQLLFIDPPLYSSDKVQGFFTLHDGPKIQSYADLNKLSIGIERGSEQPGFSLESKNYNLVQVSSLERLVTMLANKRIDTFVYSIDRASAVLEKMQVSQNIKLQKLTHLIEQGSYVALSRQSHITQRATHISTSIIKMQQSGRLREMFVQYGMGDSIGGD